MLNNFILFFPRCYSGGEHTPKDSFDNEWGGENDILKIYTKKKKNTHKSLFIPSQSNNKAGLLNLGPQLTPYGGIFKTLTSPATHDPIYNGRTTGEVNRKVIERCFFFSLLFETPRDSVFYSQFKSRRIRSFHGSIHCRGRERKKKIGENGLRSPSPV